MGVPSVQTNYDGTTCPGSPNNVLDNGGGANGLNYYTTDGGPMTHNTGGPPNYSWDDASPQPPQPAPMYLSAGAARDAAGNSEPGIYNGFAPSRGTINRRGYNI